MLIYLLLLILVGFLGLIHFSTRYSRRGRLLSKIPGPHPLPIIGNLLLFADRTQRGVWVATHNLANLYYPICVGWLLHKPMVIVRHPDDLEVVLSSPKSSYKDFPYNYLRAWLKNGLLTNNGDAYRNRRKMLTPAFHFTMLKRYINVMNEEADKLMEKFRVKGKEFVVDVLPLYTDVTLNIIIKSALGIDLDNTDKNIIEEYKEAIDEMGAITVYRLLRPYLPDWFANSFLEIGRKQKHTLKILHDFTHKIIEERRQYQRNCGYTLQGFKEFSDSLENPEFEYVYTADHKKKLAMLDLLLLAERDGLIDNQGIREEVDTVLLGGTDTSRMVIAYFTMLLAENKDVQDKARAEVCAVLDESGGKTGIAELQNMPYLEQCIKESMRVFPVGATIFRYSTDDIQLKNYVIPRDVDIVCRIFDTHRDPNFWPDPEKFDPDRFLPERTRNRHPFAFLPFSAGPRNCIGQKFGMLELKTVCASLLYNFYLEPIDYTCDIKLIGDLVLRPADPFHSKFIRIDRER